MRNKIADFYQNYVIVPLYFDFDQFLTLRFPFVVNAFKHTVQRKGLSPVCVRMWICNAEEDEKFLLHTWHKCFGEPYIEKKTVNFLNLSVKINDKNEITEIYNAMQLEKTFHFINYTEN